MSTEIELECRHRLVFAVSPPRKGDHIWCFRCADMRTVATAPADWNVRCRSCRFSRHYGVSRLAAEVAAAKHRKPKTRQWHIVELRDGHEVIHRFAPQDTALLTPNGTLPDIPPF